MCFPFLLSRQDKKRDSRLSDLVHIQLLPSARDDQRRAQFYEQLLDHVHLVSSLIATISDGPLNIPMLKNAATLVKNIAECGQVRHLSLSIRLPVLL